MIDLNIRYAVLRSVNIIVYNNKRSQQRSIIKEFLVPANCEINSVNQWRIQKINWNENQHTIAEKLQLITTQRKEFL